MGYFTLVVFLLSYGCWCLFLVMALVGLQCVFVVFPGNTYVRFFTIAYFLYIYLTTELSSCTIQTRYVLF